MGVLAWLLAEGSVGLLYLLLYGVLLVPGLPLGFALFGRRQAAGWIAGGLLGYSLTAFSWWLLVQLEIVAIWALPATWMALTAAAVAATWRVASPLVVLPRWTRGDTAALLFTLLIVPVLVGPPFLRIGAEGHDGSRHYRAYFTADFLWHTALTSELSKLSSPPRNPYLARRPLNYYWTYFNVPARIVGAGGLLESVEAHLMLNALCAGLLFVAAIFTLSWSAVPRAGPVALAVLLTIVAASAEGLYALWDLHQQGQPLAGVRDLNIDAITAWYLQSLTIDGLPRSLWYTPQHASACALSLIALVVAAGNVRHRIGAALVAGLALALAVVCSPFLGAVFSVIYGVTAAWITLKGDVPGRVRELLQASIAALPVLAALTWGAASGLFGGAASDLTVGWSARAAAAPVRTLVLALGPVLLPTVLGLILGRHSRWRWQPAIVGFAAGIFMLYFVTLESEPIWIGWRAGQILLVTMPAMVASCFAVLADKRQRRVLGLVAVTVAALGLPTTAIDAWNAQDVSHTAMGPGFRWTVVVPQDTLAATAWIREHTPADSIVQMSIEPRGRETWTLVPSFAHRRMAAGQPISLLPQPEYDHRSREADGMYWTENAEEAWRLARTLRLDYVYVDAVERRAFSKSAIDKFSDPRFFRSVFRHGNAEVFEVLR